MTREVIIEVTTQMGSPNHRQPRTLKPYETPESVAIEELQRRPGATEVRVYVPYYVARRIETVTGASIPQDWNAEPEFRVYTAGDDTCPQADAPEGRL